MNLRTRWHGPKFGIHWVFIFSYLVSATSSCHKKAIEVLEEGITLKSASENANLDRAAFYCRGVNHEALPVLFAHFLEENTFTGASLANHLEDFKGSLSCAPGPVMLKQGHKDAHITPWQLEKTPDYFAWHLSDRLSLDESMFITNPSGVPIAAQSLKLSKGLDAVLVLILKAPLQANQSYYLYLSRRTAEGHERWIQSLIVNNARSSAL